MLTHVCEELLTPQSPPRFPGESGEAAPLSLWKPWVTRFLSAGVCPCSNHAQGQKHPLEPGAGARLSASKCCMKEVAFLAGPGLPWDHTRPTCCRTRQEKHARPVLSETGGTSLGPVSSFCRKAICISLQPWLQKAEVCWECNTAGNQNENSFSKFCTKAFRRGACG